MNDTIQQSDLEAAEQAALSCLDSAFFLRTNLNAEWAVAQMKGPNAVAEFHATARRQVMEALDAFAFHCQRVPKNLLQFIATANAKAGNLPGCAIGDAQYPTAHEAAIFHPIPRLFDAIVAGVIELSDTDSQIDFVADIEPPDAPGYGKRFDECLECLKGDLPALWTAIINRMKSVFIEDVSADIRRERSFAEAYLNNSTGAFGLSAYRGKYAFTSGWNFGPGRVTHDGTTFHLRGVCFLLLKALVESEKPLTEQELIETGWGHDSDKEPKTLQNKLSELRGILRS